MDSYQQYNGGYDAGPSGYQQQGYSTYQNSQAPKTLSYDETMQQQQQQQLRQHQQQMQQHQHQQQQAGNYGSGLLSEQQQNALYNYGQSMRQQQQLSSYSPSDQSQSSGHSQASSYRQPTSAIAGPSTSRDRTAGPSRQMPSNFFRTPSTNGSNGSPLLNDTHHGTSRSEGLPNPGGAGRAGPYARPPAPVAAMGDSLGASTSGTAKASSTTSEFTKRRNWSQHIIDEIQDFMHVLTPTGSILFTAPSIRDLTGWTPEEITGRAIGEFIHADDVDGFLRDFRKSIQTGANLTAYFRFRMKDERYTIFEVSGHPYFTTDESGAQKPKCFFGIGRPYPSKNTAMLDSFLELKMENERLRQELQVMYKDIEGAGNAFQDFAGFAEPQAEDQAPSSPNESRRQSASVIDPATGLVQANDLLPSSSNTYGALGIGISATGTRGDGVNEKKKKQKPKADEGEFVCRDCGTVDSPEWRKGPDGPKSLCNACGLRYAKLVSKSNKDRTQKMGK